MAGVEDDLGAGEVEAGVVPPDLSLLGHHPVLVSSLQRVAIFKILTVNGRMKKQTYLHDRQILIGHFIAKINFFRDDYRSAILFFSILNDKINFCFKLGLQVIQ